jgi:hypothetical protein
MTALARSFERGEIRLALQRGRIAMRNAFRAMSGVLFIAIMCVASGGVAADDVLDKLNSSTDELQQLQEQLSKPAPSEQSAAAESSGTAQATAKLAASAPHYDVVGFKLGMSGKEAAAALKAHGKLQIKPETVKYDVLPWPLMYGVFAGSQELLRGGPPIIPNTEKIYLMLTMQPNPQLVSRISRYVTFSKETAPTQEVLAAELIKKYGAVSFDQGPDWFRSAGHRAMVWVDDPQGNRVKGMKSIQEIVHTKNGDSTIQNCMYTASTFSQPGAVQPNAISANDIQADLYAMKSRLEKGYDLGEQGSKTCPDYTIIHARLFRAAELGVSSNEVVGVLLVNIGSQPLDRSATDATHDLLVRADKARKAKEKGAAQKNKPAL